MSQAPEQGEDVAPSEPPKLLSAPSGRLDVFLEKTREQLTILRAVKEYLIVLSTLRQEFLEAIENRTNLAEDDRHAIMGYLDNSIEVCQHWAFVFLQHTVND